MDFRFFRSKPPELGVRAAYQEWSNNYPPYAHNALMRAEEKAMLHLLPDPLGKRVLDLGCGTGRYGRILRERGPAYLVGIDISFDMLAHADHQKAGYVQADMTSLPIKDGQFDLIICGLAMGHLESLKVGIAEIGRVLNSGGTLLYSDFHPLGYLAGWRREFKGLSGKRYAVRHYPHLYSDHDAACRSAGLQIGSVLEPIIGLDITEEFPGSQQLYKKWHGWPAVLVIRADKI